MNKYKILTYLGSLMLIFAFTIAGMAHKPESAYTSIMLTMIAMICYTKAGGNDDDNARTLCS
jgi:hypothetical protein